MTGHDVAVSLDLTTRRDWSLSLGLWALFLAELLWTVGLVVWGFGAVSR